MLGKPIGSDFHEGKTTLLLSLAQEVASRAQLGVLDRCGRPDLTDDDMADIQQVLAETQADRRVEAVIDRLFGEAGAALGQLDVLPEAKERLGELANALAYRTS